MAQTITEIEGFLNELTGKKCNIYLYFITRHPNENLEDKKILERYNFLAQQVDLSKELQDYFKDILKNQLEKTLQKEDLEVSKYSIISDDLKNKLYTYALNNALSFSKLINEQFNKPSSIKNVKSLKQIKEDLWAYCIRVKIGTDNYFSFRKASSGKVATGDSQNLKEKFMSYFDSEDLDLKQLKTEVISFDDKVDCIYIKKTFYVFSKGNFETMLGLEEEYQENANEVLKTLENTSLIEGIELVKEEAKKNKNILKILASIAKKKNHSNFDKNEIDRMKSVLKKMEGKELKVSSDNKIQLEDNQDIQGFLKLLNDFYKLGLVSDKYYGTNSGTIITPPTT
jgi:hypothetical protein